MHETHFFRCDHWFVSTQKMSQKYNCGIFFKNFPGLLFGLSAWERPGQVFQGEDVSNEAHPLQTNLLTTKSFGRHEVIGRSRRPITAFLETSLGS